MTLNKVSITMLICPDCVCINVPEPQDTVCFSICVCWYWYQHYVLLDISRQLAYMKLGRREKYQPIQYCWAGCLGYPVYTCHLPIGIQQIYCSAQTGQHERCRRECCPVWALQHIFTAAWQACTPLGVARQSDMSGPTSMSFWDCLIFSATRAALPPIQDCVCVCVCVCARVSVHAFLHERERERP